MSLVFILRMFDSYKKSMHLQCGEHDVVYSRHGWLIRLLVGGTVLQSSMCTPQEVIVIITRLTRKVVHDVVPLVVSLAALLRRLRTLRVGNSATDEGICFSSSHAIFCYYSIGAAETSKNSNSMLFSILHEISIAAQHRYAVYLR